MVSDGSFFHISSRFAKDCQSVGPSFWLICSDADPDPWPIYAWHGVTPNSHCGSARPLSAVIIPNPNMQSLPYSLGFLHVFAVFSCCHCLDPWNDRPGRSRCIAMKCDRGWSGPRRVVPGSRFQLNRAAGNWVDGCWWASFCFLERPGTSRDWFLNVFDTPGIVEQFKLETHMTPWLGDFDDQTHQSGSVELVGLGYKNIP